MSKFSNESPYSSVTCSAALRTVCKRLFFPHTDFVNSYSKVNPFCFVLFTVHVLYSDVCADVSYIDFSLTCWLASQRWSGFSSAFYWLLLLLLIRHFYFVPRQRPYWLLKFRITDFNNSATGTINSISCTPFIDAAALRLFSEMPSFRFRKFRPLF